MKAAAMAVLFLLVASSAVFPSNVEIVLKDGYLLEGIAVELRGDVYYLQQARQGQLLVPAKLVREVRTFAPPDAAPGAVMPAPEPAESEVEPETESAAHEPVVTPDVSEPPPSPAVPSPFDVGLASWYGMPFHGKKTASGETFDMHALTAAHSTLPFGTLVRVTSLENGRHVNVRITDRVPRGQRVAINLSKAGAEELQMLDRGVARVRLSIVEQ